MTVENRFYGYVAGEESYQDKVPIMEEGSKGGWACVILEGRVKVQKRTAKGFLTIDTLKEGEIFGELTLFQGVPGIRTASVVADGDVKIGILDTELILRDWERWSPHLRNLFQALVKRLKGVTDQVVSLTLENASS
jgi:CRP-like cAMP-binding protein